MENTTIAAISTAYGESGIGIVRMSGPDSFEILKKVFYSKSGKIIDFIPRHMHYGIVKDTSNNQIIDEALAVYMNAPFTYTGEDVAEIQCHGGNISVKNILSLLLKEGAVLADKGEFTKRAFLNGKMDLIQAEAVIDLIKAKNFRLYDTAVNQLEGGLSDRIRSIRSQLMDLLVNITVNMDYPDEDIEVLTYTNIKNCLLQIDDELSILNASADEGKILREGLKIAIIGKPNVGKSSFMNLILNENRSIVTDIPGTTRDTIEESASIRGIPVVFVDTAGIHDSDDIVESIGIERSKDAFNNADLIILVLDGSEVMSEEDKQLLNMCEGRPTVKVINKTDRGTSFDLEGSIKSSFKNSEGIEEIKDAIQKFVDSGKLRKNNDVLLTNIRHTELVRKALSEINEALEMTKAAEAMDFIEVNVKAAFDYLGEIIGETAGDQVIDEVFSRFCLGK